MKTVILWDLDNVREKQNAMKQQVDNGACIIVEKFCTALKHLGFPVVDDDLSLYISISRAGIENNMHTKDYLNLIEERYANAGATVEVDIIDVTGEAARDAADLSLISSVYDWACTNPPPGVIVLISKDKDFSNTITKLRQRNYIVIVIQKDIKSEDTSLKFGADFVLEWDDFSGGRSDRSDRIIHNPRSSGNKDDIYIWWDHKTCSVPRDYIDTVAPSYDKTYTRGSTAKRHTVSMVYQNISKKFELALNQGNIIGELKTINCLGFFHGTKEYGKVGWHMGNVHLIPLPGDDLGPQNVMMTEFFNSLKYNRAERPSVFVIISNNNYDYLVSQLVDIGHTVIVVGEDSVRELYKSITGVKFYKWSDFLYGRLK